MSSVTEAAPAYRPLKADLSEIDQQRISYLRLVLVLALVFLHYGGVYGSSYSPYRGYQGQDLPVASILISFVLYFGFTAVPAMSAMSGFLFFRGASRDLPPDFVTKWRRRAVTLVLPFLIWSTGFAALAFVVNQLEPSLFRSEFARDGRSLLRMLADGILGATRTPIAFQLWFVRDLIVTIAVSPVIWFLMGRLPRVTLAVIAALWVADHDLWIFQRLDVPLFFAFGAGCAMHGWRPDLPRRWIVPVFVLFLAVVMARTIAPYFVGRATGFDFDVATAAMRILGALAVWNIAALLLEGAFAAWVQRHSYMAFYIHAAHYPPILFLKIALAQVLPVQTEIGQIVLYVTTVLLIIWGLIISAHILQRWTPGLFKILSGGRSRPGEARRGGFLTA